MLDSNMQILNEIISSYQFKAKTALTPVLGKTFSFSEKAKENYIPFYCVERGGGSLSMNGNLYELNQGDFVAVMQGQNHSINNKTNNPPDSSRLICGHFQVLSGDFSPVSNSFPEVVHIKKEQISQSQPLQPIISILMTEANAQFPGFKLIINNLAEMLFVLLLRNTLKNHTLNSGILAALSDEKLSKSIIAFHDSFNESWSMDRLAERSGMSRSAYINRFQKVVGIAPGNYITRWRLNWAAKQLVETNKAIIEIAIGSGYNSDAAFCRIFSQRFGFSPSKYRKLYK